MTSVEVEVDLSALPRSDLIAHAKSKGITGLSKLSKQQVLEHIKNPPEPKPRGPTPWTQALKQYNETMKTTNPKHQYIIPRKETEEYNAVLRYMEEIKNPKPVEQVVEQKQTKPLKSWRELHLPEGESSRMRMFAQTYPYPDNSKKYFV